VAISASHTHMDARDLENGAYMLADGTMIYVPEGGGTAKISRRTTGIVIADQEATPGLCYLKWQSDDTDTVGTFKIEFEFTPDADSDKFTFPSPEYGPAQVIVGAGLDSE